MSDFQAEDAPSAVTGKGRSRGSCTTGVAVPAACLALVIAGCTPSSEPTAPPRSGAAVASVTGTASAPQSAPQSSALKTIDPAAFQAAVDAAAKELLVPGAVVRLRTPQGTFDAIVGTAESGTRTPPGTDMHFRIASNTKTLTAALIVLLAQDGTLRLDDPVAAYVPGVPNGGNITITQLLTMRSGLYNYTDAPELSATLDADPTMVWTPQEVMDLAFARPPDFPPGTSYEYSNTNYALLGLVAEVVGGRPLAQQFEDRLLGPLGLGQTSLPAVDDATLPEAYSHGYMYGGTAYAMLDQEYPADMRAAARNGILRPHDYTNQNPSYATAAGGVVSTADDMATWIRALVSGKVFDPGHHQQWLHSLQPEDRDKPDGRHYGYGISWQHFGPNASMYYHGGELPGFNSFIGYDPDNDVTLVVWTNLTLSPDGRTTANALLPAILDAIYAGLSPASAPTPGMTR